MEILSIIVPVYNSENRLENCIKSILNQTFKNFELILINDGSTDKSGYICNKYRDKDKRVKVIYSRNRGVSFARNLGIKKARGQYIGFVDSDDEVDKDMFFILLKNIKNDFDFSMCSYKLIYKKNINIMKLNFDREITIKDKSSLDRIISKFFCEYSLDNKIQQTIMGSVCLCLFNLNIIKENNIWFNEEISYTEDMLFIIAYLNSSNKYIFIDKPLYNYIKGKDDSNFVKYKYSKNLFNSTQVNIKEIEKILENNNLRDKFDKVISYKKLSTYNEEISNVCMNGCNLNRKEKIDYLNEIFNNMNLKEDINKFKLEEFKFLKGQNRVYFKNKEFNKLVRIYQLKYKLRDLISYLYIS